MYLYFLFFVIYVTVSPISNTMLKLHNTWIKFIIIIIIIVIIIIIIIIIKCRTG